MSRTLAALRSMAGARAGVFTGGLVLGLAAIGPGCSSAAGSADAGAPPAAAPTQDAAPAGSHRLVDEDPGYAGVVLPAVAVDVAPTYEGKLEAVHVAVGQTVAAGASLASFDPAAAREALAIAQAELRAAKGRAGEAAAASKHARRRLETERTLYAQGITAAAEVASAQADRAQAGAATASAAGEIGAAKARVEQLQRQLGETALAAPFAGTVAAVYRESGALAGPSAPVLRLIDRNQAFVRFAVPPGDRASMPVGAIVDVRLEWDEAPLTAAIRDVAPEVDAPTGMVFVEADLTPDSAARSVPNSPVWITRRVAPPPPVAAASPAAAGG